MWPFTSPKPITPAAPTATPDSADKCPVDHTTRAAWLAANPGRDSPFQAKQGAAAFTQAAASTSQDSASSSSSSSASPDGLPVRGKTTTTKRLSEDRVVSSIPRHATTSTPKAESTPTLTSTSSPSSTPTDDPNWVYPSEAQFFRAMLRKHQAGLYQPGATPPNPADMQTIVPIHNAVNEKAWAEVLKWEAGQGGDKCGGIRLVSFKGRPKERTPRAWINVALGYTAPFDRHDWVINRCGEEVRYVIDFYSGRPATSIQASPDMPSAGNLSFHLDVRPALDGWEGARLRMSKLFGM